MLFDKSINLSGPQFPHQENENVAEIKIHASLSKYRVVFRYGYPARNYISQHLLHLGKAMWHAFTNGI